MCQALTRFCHVLSHLSLTTNSNMSAGFSKKQIELGKILIKERKSKIGRESSDHTADLTC